MTLSQTPAYNIKVVLNKTGIAADTLRAWERRYGLPIPQRTPGGHRLYSEYDIETIKWLMARQEEGLSISRAVELWKEQIASGRDPLAGAASQASSTLTATPANTSLDTLRADWIAACLKFNETDAEQVLNQAFSLFPVEAVCTNILQKALSEIGELWYANRASVQQEHFASALAMRRLDALLAASPAPFRKQTIIVGCPAEEWHAFTPLLLSLLLRRRGWQVVYLGANVPTERFEETVAAVRANLVILVAQTLITAAALQSTAQTLTALGICVGYGGRIFNIHPTLSASIPAHYLGDTLNASLNTVETLLQAPVEPVQARSLPPEYLEAYRMFTAHRLHIESTVKENVPPEAQPKGFEAGIHFLSDNIAAALQLGNMQYLDAEMEWLKVLMEWYQRPAEELTTFMETYSQAVDQHINGSGSPIKAWLKAQAKSVNSRVS